MIYISNPTGPVRGPCVTGKGCRTAPFGHVRELTQPKLAKISHGRRIWPHGSCTGPARAVHGLFMILNPYGARKLIMHALKLHGPHTGRQNSYGAARGPCGPREWTYDFCSKQPGTVREQPVRGPGVWCGWGINNKMCHNQYRKLHSVTDFDSYIHSF